MHVSRQIGQVVSGAAQRSHTQMWPHGIHARDFWASRHMTHCSSRGDCCPPLLRRSLMLLFALPCSPIALGAHSNRPRHSALSAAVLDIVARW